MRPQEYAELSMATDVRLRDKPSRMPRRQLGGHILTGPQGYIGEAKHRRSKAFLLLIPTIRVSICVSFRLAHRRHSSA
jgi:hypothetical protein